MCDYSLDGVASRSATVGDKLVTRQFWNTNTRGFSTIEKPSLAVCLLPGTEIVFESEVERELTGFQLLSSRRRKERRIPYMTARFRQLNTDNPHTHHDALEFPNGETVLLTHLRAGQRATVLQLPVQVWSSEKSEGRTTPVEVG